MIVADTNVLVALEVENECSDDARTLLRIDPEWRLPTLWRYEFANVMVTSVRTGRMGEDVAKAAMRHALGRFGPCEADVDWKAVLELALPLGLSAYDASFLAVARDLGVRLISQDKALVARSQSMAVGLKDYLGGRFMAGDAVSKGWSKKPKPKQGR